MGFSTLRIAGILAIFAAAGHGWLGDQTLRNLPWEESSPKNFVRCCYQFGSVGWLAGAVILLASNRFDEAGLQTIGFALIPLYGFGAMVNMYFTKGRHLGWVLLTAVCVLIGIGTL